MASDKHLAKLKDGAEAWNEWRRAEPSLRPDLTGLSLTLGEKQWGETNGGPIDFSRALLGDANFRHATLMHANLSESSLVGANLAGARLQKADLRNANLTNARLDDADLDGALLMGADLSGADLRSARNLKPEQLEAARGDPKTLLPSRFVTPRGWMNGSRRSDPVVAEPAAAKQKWTGSFAKSPVAKVSAEPSSVAKAPVAPAANIASAKAPGPDLPAPAGPDKTSWMTSFAKPAVPSYVQSLAAARGSWISAFAKPGAAVGSDLTPQRMSWAAALAKTAAVPAAAASAAAASAAAAVSAAAAARANWTAGFLKSPSGESTNSESKTRSVLDDAVVTARAPAETKIADGTRAELKSADAKREITTAADTKIVGDEAVAVAVEVKPDKVEVVAAKPETRATRFSDALTGNSAKAAESDLDADHDVDGEPLDEGPDPRWIADLARSAGATPLEEAAQRVKDWSNARVRQFASFKPARSLRVRSAILLREGKSRFARAKPLLAPVTSLKDASDAVGASPRKTSEDLHSSLAASLEPMGTMGTRIAMAGAVVVLLLVAGAVRFAPWHGAWTLKENVPLSAHEVAQDDETPQHVTIAEAKPPVVVDDLKGQQRVEPLAKPSAETAPIKSAVPLAAIKPIGVSETSAPGMKSADTKPIGVKESVAAAVKIEDVPKPVQVRDSAAPAAIQPQNLPIPERVREKGTQIALAAPDKISAAAAKTTDASDTTTVAQAARSDEMRQHGELAAPDASDPATPLVAPPKPAVAAKTVAAPMPADDPKPAPVPEKKPDAPSAEANKLSFAGEGLNALQAPKKPPATVVEYLKEPTKTTAWIETFIKKFYLSSAALSDQEIRSIYSEPMDFFGEKNVDLDRVAREKADYYAEWPKRHYKLVPGSIEVQWTSDSVAEVSFLYDFNVSAPEKPGNKGRGRAVLTIDLTESPGRIIREDGEVVATD